MYDLPIKCLTGKRCPQEMATGLELPPWPRLPEELEVVPVGVDGGSSCLHLTPPVFGVVDPGPARARECRQDVLLDPHGLGVGALGRRLR